VNWFRVHFPVLMREGRSDGPRQHKPEHMTAIESKV